MNKRERFLTALQGGVPDRVPVFEFYWGLPFIETVLGDRQVSVYHNADDEVAMSKATDIDMVYSAPYGFTAFTSVQLHGEEYQDEWGTRWGSNQESWPGSWPICEVVKSRQDWKKLDIPDPTLPRRMEQPLRTVALANGDLAVVGGIRGPFSAVWMLAGLTNMGMWIYDDPEFLDELLGAMGRWNTQLGLQLIEAGVDAISIHDDWGMNEATFIGPDHWKQFVLPHIAEEIATLADTGTPIILHSDGNINRLMDEIVQLKISALNPLQRSAHMDLAEIKAKYGDRLCLIGNISTSATLAQGTPQDVEREVLECLRDAAPGGGYIMAPDHSFHSAIPFENIWAVLNTCREYGAYPLNMGAILSRLQALGER
ncbi:MAG: hypothetical protein GY759_04035 [Chloroflexi bacterium]|nr:hypothetical protein [Chloroflexota bacterium]